MRLASFSNWPVEPAVSPVYLLPLAAAGFRYTGDSDSVVCGHCGTVVRGWLGKHHSPLVEHRCRSRHVIHHATEHISTSGSSEETDGSCRKTSSELETMSRSCDVAASSVSTLTDSNGESDRCDDSETPQRRQRAPGPASAASLLTRRRMALPTCRDVTDAATAVTAGLSNSLCSAILTLHCV